jgi:hypothetical protein
MSLEAVSGQWLVSSGSVPLRTSLYGSLKQNMGFVDGAMVVVVVELN